MNGSLERTIKELGPWFHQIQVEDGVRTRDINPTQGPQPINHPANRWSKVKNHLPHDLTGMRVLDVGCSDGFFSIEMAKRGAEQVISIDAAGKPIRRLRWLANHLGYADVIHPRVGSIYELREIKVEFDFVLMFALLYHLDCPLLGLEAVAAVGKELWIETIVAEDNNGSYLKFQPPQEGIHSRPKWFPTTRCLRDMLGWVGFTNIIEIAPPVDNRPILVANHRR